MANKKFADALKEACKDFGLTDTAIEGLAEAGSEGLDDNTSAEVLKARVDAYSAIAKLMQGEVTRKISSVSSRKKQSNNSESGNIDHNSEGAGGASEGGDGSGNDVLAMLSAMRADYDKKFEEILSENKSLKASRDKESRKAAIATKAKELGIPASLMKRYSIADDADYEKDLTEYKQELINQQLISESPEAQKASRFDLMKKEAENWAKSLPDAKE